MGAQAGDNGSRSNTPNDYKVYLAFHSSGVKWMIISLATCSRYGVTFFSDMIILRQVNLSIKNEPLKLVVFGYHKSWEFLTYLLRFKSCPQSLKFELQSTFINPFKCQPHKMVKHIHTIRRQITDELFECVWLFYRVDA